MRSPSPPDLVEHLADLASIHAEDQHRPLFDISGSVGQQEHEGSGRPGGC